MDTLATYEMYVIMAYLTTIWDLSFTKATAIVNVFWGSVAVSLDIHSGLHIGKLLDVFDLQRCLQRGIGTFDDVDATSAGKFSVQLQRIQA